MCILIDWSKYSVFEKMIKIASFYGVQLMSGRLKLKVRNTALSMEMRFDSFDSICESGMVVNGDKQALYNQLNDSKS